MQDNDTLIAHISKDGTIQSVYDHNHNTAIMAASFAIDDLKDVCFESGDKHDDGKHQLGFQQKFKGINNRIEHSICGAKEVIAKYGQTNLVGLLEALCIAGHHSGLPDCGTEADSEEESTLYGRLKRTTEPYNAVADSCPVIEEKKIIDLIKRHCDVNDAGQMLECYAFLTRYCFSCLVDADSLDTAKAMGEPLAKPLKTDFQKCLEIVDKRLSSFIPKTELQSARGRLQKQVFANIDKNADIYTIGMPLGSGKTLASVKYALERAIKTGKRRIIYIIPYNSIIDQTAKDFNDMFKKSAEILRHQSSFSYEDKENISEDYRLSALYSTENWDADFIITTSVQFFESIYASKRSKARKIHNMANSILVFDEVHLMPVEYLQACLRAVAFITKYLNSEAIFMTATMPDFGPLIKKYALPKVDILDLVPDRSDFKYFKKNQYIDLGEVSHERLLKEAQSYASSLIVVNSKKEARILYKKCTCRNKYHLSTYMPPGERLRVIDEIRTRLDMLNLMYPRAEDVPKEERIVLISTSLIEAGIDLDFVAAFRELYSLPSLLQTGGRSNREGRYPIGNVFSFELNNGRKIYLPEQSITKNILKKYKDISSEEAVTNYYDRIFAVKADEITENSLAEQCSPLRFNAIPFRSYSVKLIDTNTESIVVPTDEYCKDLIRKAESKGYAETRKLQSYCCSVYEAELEELLRQRAVKEVAGVYVLENMNYYDPDTGIAFESKDIWI